MKRFIKHLLKKDEYSSLRDFLDKNTSIDMDIESKLCEYVVQNADIPLKVTTKAYEIIRSTLTMDVKSYKKKVRVLGVKYEVKQFFNLLLYFEATVIEVIERSDIKIKSEDIASIVDILDNDAYTIEEMIDKVKEFDSKTEDYELRNIKRTYTFLDSELTDAELIAMDKLEIARLNYVNKLKKTKA